jgi:hypothetical protein
MGMCLILFLFFDAGAPYVLGAGNANLTRELRMPAIPGDASRHTPIAG